MLGELLLPQKVYETLVKVAAIGPNTQCTESPVAIDTSEFPPKGIGQDSESIPGEDRQMLAQIVEKWGNKSDELKQAALRVVG